MPRGDLLPPVQYDLPVEVVLFDRSSSGMVEREMLISGRLRTERRITVRTAPRAPRRRGSGGAHACRARGAEQLTGAPGADSGTRGLLRWTGRPSPAPCRFHRGPVPKWSPLSHVPPERSRAPAGSAG
ncbi:hypothetical protein ACFWAR_12045 [Streptomyces sp. NPDC059917]|uniref:hypothetical protein n=1 Tax=Streptomyces sp. NPDC059917 TaxID=3347002 RepID=UPI00365C71BB